MRLEPPLPAAWEQPQEQLLLAHLLPEQPEPQRREQQVSQRGQLAARLALPQEQQVSQPH